MRAVFFGILALVLCSGVQAQERIISSLGRIEPAGGLIRVAGPSGLSSVLMDLRVAEGDSVEAGQVLAMLNEYPVRQADLRRLQAELENAKSQLAREQTLASKMASAASKLEGLELEVEAAQAAVSAAEAMLDLALVRSPIDGQVLYIHTRPGERVGPEGVLEVGDTRHMYAVAEVYETDILYVKKGQRASISSPALSSPVSGTVENIGLKVGRMDVLGMDPVAEADARVIEVDILLDDPETVRALTNLQVEVEITPG